MAFCVAEIGLTAAFGAGFVAAVVAGCLELGEEVSYLLGKDLGSTEVVGALSAVLDVGESVVGAEAASVVGAVGGDDGPRSVRRAGRFRG